MMRSSLGVVFSLSFFAVSSFAQSNPYTLSTSEEGREMLVVAVSDEANLAKLDRYKEITARLADPRGLPEAEAQKLIAEGKPIAEKPAAVDVPHGKGHVVLFANNPMWRGETSGSYFLVFNAILNFDHLDAGSAAAPATK
jgi:hypothetical protein